MNEQEEACGKPCGKPCDPQLGNACCESYWIRMKAEGFWDGHQWTDKGVREFTK